MKLNLLSTVTVIGLIAMGAEAMLGQWFRKIRGGLTKPNGMKVISETPLKETETRVLNSDQSSLVSPEEEPDQELIANEQRKLVETAASLIGKYRWNRMCTLGQNDYMNHVMKGISKPPNENQSMNCWQMILVVAVLAGILQWPDVLKLEQEARSRGLCHDCNNVYNAIIFSALNLDKAKTVTWNMFAGTSCPRPGSIVFFDGKAHVAISDHVTENMSIKSFADCPLLQLWVKREPNEPLCVNGPIHRTTFGTVQAELSPQDIRYVDDRSLTRFLLMSSGQRERSVSVSLGILNWLGPDYSDESY